MIISNKKLVLSLKAIVTFIFILIFSIPCFAKNNVSKITKDITLHNNGSMTVVEQWIGTFDEGTEVYIPIEDKSLRVSNLKVAKDGVAYKEVERWRVDATFENKAFRYGINRTGNGVELCFGISKYGENTYAFSYDIDPVVKSYDDYDGFNFQFVNPNMSTYPTSINITLHHEDQEKYLSTDFARIWAFGFEGNATISDGYAQVFSISPLDGSNYCNIMMKFNKGLFTPNIKVDGSFEERVESVAFENSDYEKALQEAVDSQEEGRDLFPYILTFLGIAGFFFFVFASICSKINRKNILKAFYKESNYFRDKPNNGNILMTHALYKDFNLWKSKDTNFLGALIVKMINDKNLVPIQEKSYGFFGNEKINTNLKLGPEPSDPIVKELYDIIVAAAGSDGILQEKELNAYAGKNPDALVDYVDSIESKGHTALNKEACYNKIYGSKLKDLTEKGQSELGEVYGLRKFLDEFTLIKERGIMEGIIWEDLLVYATLFGLAEKVLKELKEVYPNELVKVNNYTQIIYISDIYYRSLYTSSLHARNALNAAKYAQMAAKGFGGSVSFGGGGGFSGGGFGGGTR